MTDIPDQQNDQPDLPVENTPLNHEENQVVDDDPTRKEDQSKQLTESEVPINRVLQDTQNQPKSSESNRMTHVSNSTSLNNNHTTPQVSIDQQLQKAKRDLESMVLKYAKSESDNLQNKNKVEELDRKLKRAIKDNDQLANRIKILTNDKSHLTDTLNAKVAQLTVLTQKNSFLNDAQKAKLEEYEEKVKNLEATNDNLLKQIESYKTNEGELLEFSERLSMKHMMLQSELDAALKKVPDYKVLYDKILEERDSLILQNMEQLKQIKLLNETIDKEREYSQGLRKDKEESDAKFKYSLDELHNEIKVMRRKHQITIKELTKEVKLLQATARPAVV